MNTDTERNKNIEHIIYLLIYFPKNIDSNMRIFMLYNFIEVYFEKNIINITEKERIYNMIVDRTINFVSLYNYIISIRSIDIIKNDFIQIFLLDIIMNIILTNRRLFYLINEKFNNFVYFAEYMFKNIFYVPIEI
jgi:hypothetical protein